MTMINERIPMDNGIHVCVLGLIGAGKSTFTHHFSEEVRSRTGRVQALYEPASKSNPYLSDYYENPDRWCFEIQIFLLSRRFEQQMLAQSLAFSGTSVVQDSSLFSDSCFVSLLEKDGTMSGRDADTYFRLFQNMSRFVLYPTTIVYLDSPIEVCQERIRKRYEEKEGRKCESVIGKEYLMKLKLELEVLLSGFSRYTHVVRVPWEVSLTSDQIREKSGELYDQIRTLCTVEPIRCFQGIDIR